MYRDKTSVDNSATKSSRVAFMLTCYGCQLTLTFDKATEAIDAGWDCPDQVVVCPACKKFLHVD